LLWFSKNVKENPTFISGYCKLKIKTCSDTAQNKHSPATFDKCSGFIIWRACCMLELFHCLVYKAPLERPSLKCVILFTMACALSASVSQMSIT